MKAPIIVGCAPSSGSTLLRTILGRHPSIFAGGELALLDKRALLKEPPESYRASIASWLDRGYPADFLGPSETLFEELDEYPWNRDDLREMCVSTPDYAAMIDAFYGRAVELSDASRWLDKCPSNIYCFDLIEELYPGARFIQIIRDARDTVVSYCRRGASAFKSVARWYYATISGLPFCGRPNFLRIRYEDLVTSPETVLRGICEFLDEPYLDRLLRSGNGAADPRHSGWRHSATGPVKEGSVRQFESEMTDRQRALFSQMRLAEPAGRLLAKLGLAEAPSPLELQRLHGYSAESLQAGALLNREQLEVCWLEFAAYRQRVLSRYGVSIECPVRLLAAGAAS
jgi:hypothetical protein